MSDFWASGLLLAGAVGNVIRCVSSLILPYTGPISEPFQHTHTHTRKNTYAYTLYTPTVPQRVEPCARHLAGHPATGVCKHITVECQQQGAGVGGQPW
jgi:hypothetical protein